MRLPLRRSAALLLFAACAGDGAVRDAALQVAVDRSGAYPVTTIRGTPTLGTLTDTLLVVPDSAGGFNRPRSMAFDRRGALWIYDEGDNVLARYGTDGRLAERRGRNGEGPGEYRGISGIALRGDTLYATDPGTGRLMRWLPDGTPDSTWLLSSRLTGGATDVRWFEGADGPRMFSLIREDTVMKTGWIRLPGGAPGDTVWQAPRPTAQGGTNGVKTCHPPDKSLRFFSSPFGPRWHTVPYRGATVEVGDGAYRIATRTPAGDTTALVVRDVARVPVTDSAYDAAMTDWTAFRAKAPGVPCDGEFVRHREKPAVRLLTTDPDGRLWVEREGPDGVFWEVWRGDTLLGALPAPPRDPYLPPAIRGDRLAVVVALEEGPAVRVYRFRGIPGGGD